MKYLLILAAMLLGESAFGQYLIDSYAGRLGPVPGTPATNALIDAWGLTLGPTGNPLYCSTQQVVEIDAAGNIGMMLGPNDLRFDLADSGDRAYDIAACTSDSSGNIYLLDWDYWRLLKIDPTGAMVAISVPQGPFLYYPPQVAVSSSGSAVYVSGGDGKILSIDFAGGTTSVVAGTGVPGQPSAPDGSPAIIAPIQPIAITAGADGTLYLIDCFLLRSIDSQGLLRTIGSVQSNGSVNGCEVPGPLVTSPDGTLLVAVSSRVRRVDPTSGAASTIAGGKPVYSSSIRFPLTGLGLLQDANGTIYVSEPAQIKRVDDASGVLTPIAGTGLSAFSGDPVPASAVQLDGNAGPSRTAAAADGTLYIAEPQEQRIRVIDPATKISTTIAAYLDSPFQPSALSALAIDTNGNVLFTESCSVQSLNPSSGSPAVVVAGSLICGSAADGVPALANQFAQIFAIAVDSTNSLYIFDQSIWKVDANTGLTSKLADAQVLAPFFPRLSFPINEVVSMAVDASNNVYLAFQFHGGIVKVAPDGSASLFAGDTGYFFDSTWSSASLQVIDMAMGPDAALYISLGDSVSRADLGTGELTSIAGSPATNVPPDSGDGGPALNARLNSYGIAIGGGSIFITDNYYVRRIYPAPLQKSAQ